MNQLSQLNNEQNDETFSLITEEQKQELIKRIKDTGKKLTPNERKFCQIYALDPEKAGNGMHSATAAFYRKQVNVLNKNSVDYDKQLGVFHNRANGKAVILLQKSTVLQHLDAIIEFSILNDEAVDRRLSNLIAQDAEKRISLDAIKVYNEIRSRVKTKVDIRLRGAIAHGHFYPEDEKAEHELMEKYRANTRERILKDKDEKVLRNPPLD